MDNNVLFQLVERYGYQDISNCLVEERKKITMRYKNLSYDDKLNSIVKKKKFLPDEVCKWIIHESECYATENDGWTTKRHKNYPTTDLPVRQIPALSTPIINMIISNIFPIIGSHYNLNPFFLNIVDIFVVKYTVDGQNHLEFHRDGSIISFNILLNDEFEGGGTIIRHRSESGGISEVLHESETGDLFIHSGKLLHSGNKITLGTRYIIVGFIEYSFFLMGGRNGIQEPIRNMN